MAVSRAEVRRIAKLARLRFSEEDEERLSHELSRILDYVGQLEELDTEGVPPMHHVLDDLQNAFRPDEPQKRISREEGLKNAPDADSLYVRVPKVIE